MATRKTGSRSRAASDSQDATKAISDSAQKIWLAGLGAYERARSEGPRMFDVLVEQGLGIGGKAREAADQALQALRDGAVSAGGRFDKLEQVFEQRVSRSLSRLGVLTRSEVAELSHGVRELADEVRSLMAQQQAPAGRAAKSTRKGARRGSATAARTAHATTRKAKRGGRKAARKATRG